MSFEKRAFYEGFVEVLLASGIPQSQTQRLIKQALDMPAWAPYAAAGVGGAALGGLGGYGLGKMMGGPEVPDWLQEGQVQAPSQMTPEDFAALTPYEQAYALGLLEQGGQEFSQQMPEEDPSQYFDQ
jgi:hypothetical protein